MLAYRGTIMVTPLVKAGTGKLAQELFGIDQRIAFYATGRSSRSFGSQRI